MQVAIALFAAGHDVPHAPQLLTLVAVSSSQPSRGSPLQLAKLPVHEYWHCPRTHEAAAFARIGHALESPSHGGAASSAMVMASLPTTVPSTAAASGCETTRSIATTSGREIEPSGCSIMRMSFGAHAASASVVSAANALPIGRFEYMNESPQWRWRCDASMRESNVKFEIDHRSPRLARFIAARTNELLAGCRGARPRASEECTRVTWAARRCATLFAPTDDPSDACG